MTKKTLPLFSVRLPDSYEWPHATVEGTYVELQSWISQEEITTRMLTIQLKALTWQSKMRRNAATKVIAQDMMEYAMALTEKDDCPLIRWVFGDSSALKVQVWEVPLNLWLGALNALTQSAYAYTRRSDWHESHARHFWREISKATEMCVWGWPLQSLRRIYDAEGEAPEDFDDGELPF
jgi:hypothetical protein